MRNVFCHTLDLSVVEFSSTVRHAAWARKSLSGGKGTVELHQHRLGAAAGDRLLEPFRYTLLRVVRTVSVFDQSINARIEATSKCYHRGAVKVMIC